MGKTELKAIECDDDKQIERKQDEEEEEEEEKVKCNILVAKRKNIKKAKWKFRCSLYPSIKQTECFYLYGSLVLHTDYTPWNIYSCETMDIVQRHQQISNVAINKQIGSIETNFNVINPGLLDFAFLVQHFENKQLQVFYDFAQSLKNFKIFVDVINQNIVDKKKILRSMPKILDVLEQQYFQFENWANDIIEKHFKDEFFGYQLFQSNYRKGYAELKKSVTSQNTISLLGQTVEDVYEAEICKMKNKSVQFEKYQDLNIDQMIEMITYIISATSSSLPHQTKRLNFTTIEGFQIPGTLEIYKLKYSDYKKDDPNFHCIAEHDYIMIINVLKVEDVWLKKLIDIRKELENYKKPKNPPLILEPFYALSCRNSLIFKEEDDEILKTAIINSRDDFSYDGLTESMDISEKIIETSVSNANFNGKSDAETINTETSEYFTPEVIDLAGNKEHQEYLQRQIQQIQQKEKIAQNLNKFYQLQQQEVELSNIEYSCQVEYFLDKFYPSDNDKQKQCQYKII